MASEDIPVMTLILNQLSDMRRENAEFRLELKQDMQEFKAEMKQDIANVRQENAEFRREILQVFKDNKAELATNTVKQNAKIDAFEAKTDKQFEAIQQQLTRIEARLIGVEHDTAGLIHWNYWILTLIVALIAAPQILSGIRAIFGAVAEGVSAVLSAFRKRDKSSD